VEAEGTGRGRGGGEAKKWETGGGEGGEGEGEGGGKIDLPRAVEDLPAEGALARVDVPDEDQVEVLPLVALGQLGGVTHLESIA
jgi:hypothetical protein